MEKKKTGILDSSAFIRFSTALLFVIAGLLSALILGSSNTKKENLANLLTKKGGECPAGYSCDGPTHTKTRTDNRNGTYTLALTVVGESRRQPNKANVIVVFDTSSSMNTNTGNTTVTYTPTSGTGTGLYGLINDEYVLLERRNEGSSYRPDYHFYYNNQEYTGQRYSRQQANQSRLAAAKEAVNNLAESLLSNNGVNGNDPDTIEIALVDFANMAEIAHQPTTDLASFQDAVNDRDAGNNNRGTNWEAGLREVMDVDFDDEDPTFVIFVSDGNPTFYLNNNGTRGGSGQETTDNINTSYNQALPAAQAIVNAGHTFYTIGIYGNVDRMESLTTGAGAPAENYYSAANTAALQEAFAQILAKIEMIGVGDVLIEDGTTANVETSQGVSHLLEVDTSSYKYYKGGEEWPDAPEAVFDPDTGAVNWDLSSVGVLENGVEYKVTFDVYPSQETYDLVANLRNGEIQYSEVDPEIRKYLSEDYKLETNTLAKLTYTDTRPETATSGTTVYYTELDGEDIVSPSIVVEKIWNNELDGRNPVVQVYDEEGNPVYNEDGTPKTEPLVLHMHLKRNGTLLESEEFVVTANSDPNKHWKDSRYISTGLLKVDSEGNIKVLDPGYDYTLEEPELISYHWELTIETIHPMVIGESLITLVEVTGNDIPTDLSASTVNNVYRKIDGKDYYKFNGKVYWAKYSGAVVNLNAFNNRKSYIEFKKDVTGDAPAGKEFNFEFKVDNVIGSNETDDDVWFSVWDTIKNEQVYDLEVTNATAEESDDGVATGYYYADNHSTISVKLQKGWSLRVINLGTGSTYTIEEKNIAVLTDGMTTDQVNEALEASNPQYFAFKEITKTIKTDGANSTYAPTITNTKIEGSVVEPNSSHSYTYINNYPGTYLTVNKKWIVSDETSITGKTVDVQLYQSIAGGEETPVEGRVGTLKVVKDEEGNIIEDESWTYTFEGLPIATEEATPRTITYSVKEVEVEGYTSSLEHSSKDNHIWTITNVEQRNVVVTKVWVDGNNQDGLREEITLKLKANGSEVTGVTPEKEVDATDSNKWIYTYTGLDKFDENGEEITYTVEEVETDVITGTDGPGTYAYEVTGDADSGFTVTNTHTPETVDVEGQKTWDDAGDQDGIRPDSITVNLLADGEQVDSATVEEAEDGTWTYSFTDLPKYNAGTEIEYTVEEVQEGKINGDKVTGYEGVVTGYNITNTHTPETVTIDVTKVWSDNNNEYENRPNSITVHLFADDVELTDRVATITAAEDGTWTYSFTDLPKYEDGTEIAYTITEDAVTGYATEITGTAAAGYTITNSTDTTEVTINKVWEDNDDEFGNRPGSIEITLKANDEEFKTQTVRPAENGDWTYTFTNLPTHIGKEEVTYTVEEEEVAGYETTYSKDTLTITNTTDTTEVTVNKVWNDNNDEFGNRPGSIEITLKANNDVFKTQSITPDANGNWTYTFEDLPTHIGKEEITYTVEEAEVAGYETTYSSDTLTITNTTDTTEVTINKVWNDNNDEFENRPGSIEITLKANDEEFDTQTVTPDEDGNWTYTFTDLPTHIGKEQVTYTVEEAEVAGYETTYSDDTLTITNTLARTEVSVTKVWEDNSDQDGLQPDSVTINLLADGDEFDSVVLDSSNNWAHTFENLPTHIDGKEVTYTVDEVREGNINDNAKTGYSVDITGDAETGFTVTNTHETELITVAGQKTWEDAGDQDGIRPESITVNLLADGTKIDSATVTEDENGNWKYSFANLPKYRDEGTEIVYTIEEVQEDKINGDKVTGYEATITGYNITNTHTPETVEVEGTKTWEDAGDQDGIRPESITVNLLADGTKVDSAIVREAEDGTWTYSFEDLPKYNDGTEIVYTIEEVQEGKINGDKVTGYETTITGYNITNTHTPEVISIDVKKTWDDQNGYEGLREDSVTINLMDGDKVVKTTTLNDENEWKDTFTDLPKYRAGKEGEEIEYTVEEVITTQLEKYYTTTVTGSIEKGFEVINSREVEHTSVSVNKVWEDNKDSEGFRPETVTINLLADGTKVDSVDLSESNKWTYTFENLDVYADGVEIEYTVEEVETDVITGTDGTGTYAYEITGDAEKGFTVTNTHTPETTEASVKKVWNDNNNQDGKRPTELTMTLSNGQTVTLTEDNGWTDKIENLPKYKDGKEIEYTWTEGSEATDAGYEQTDETVNGTLTTITNSIDAETTAVNGSKTWDDAGDQDGIRPESITVNLLADGTKIDSATVTEAEDGTWTYSFTDLPKYRDEGTTIVYTIEEVQEGKINGNKTTGYEATITGYNITNTHTPEATSVKVTKAWEDDKDRDGIRPTAVSVVLLANGEVVEGQSVTLNEGNKWTDTFTGLPKYKDGEEIEYTVQEIGLPSTYTSATTGDASTGYTITNTHEPATVDIEGTKTWDDNDDQDGKRPDSITVNLLADGEKVDSATVREAEDGTWTYSFTGLKKFKDGKEIAYTITEEKVANYEGKVTGYNITNTHEPEKIRINGEKAWVDANNQDGLRPESITINLLADGEKVDSVTITEANKNSAGNWEYEFTGKPKYKDGVEIAYTIEEVKTDVINGNAETGYSITINNFNIVNTHNPSKKVISGTKTWDDADDQDGKRPDSITVILKADGEQIDSVVVRPNEKGEWTYEFTDLPEYKDGNKIDYKIDEADVEGYSKEINTYDIKNIHEPAKITISGTKTWEDEEDQDGKRPESITVNLLADGEKVDSVDVTPAEDGTWTYSFEGKPKYKAGEEIVYTVTEEEVEGYETTIPEGEYNITNSHTPETVTYNITKEWVDEENNDGIRPDSITVKLLANGKVVETATVKADENGEWKYSFGPYAKYKAGVEIEYTIEEEKVAGYTTTISDPVTTENATITRVITNTHESEKIDINGKKTWVDDDNKAGKRPTSITVYVYADSKLIATLVVTEESNWEYELKNLYKFNNGKKITYSIEELPVEDYETEIEGFNITNTYTDIEGEELPPDTYVDGTSTTIVEFVLLLAGAVILRTFRKIEEA